MTSSGQGKHFIIKITILKSKILIHIPIRHWQIMQEKTGIYTDEEYLNFKMNIFRPLDQEFFKNIIVDAIEVAQEEARIEEELTAIRLRWEEREFLICFMICTKR